MAKISKLITINKRYIRKISYKKIALKLSKALFKKLCKMPKQQRDMIQKKRAEQLRFINSLEQAEYDPTSLPEEYYNDTDWYYSHYDLISKIDNR